MIDGTLVTSQHNNLQDLISNSDSFSHLLTKKYAVVVNQNFIPKTDYSMTRLHENDQVEIFVPIQGG